jgi:hypothetical protein
MSRLRSLLACIASTASIASIASIASTACTGEVQPLGLDEPVRIINGAFSEGALPGTTPLMVGETAPEGVPTITSVESGSGIGTPGQLRRNLLGRASEDTFAIGVKLAELGSGYWVVPAGAVNPAVPGERDFVVDLSLGPIPPGIHRLWMVAIDGAGNGGPRVELPLCILDPSIPDDLSPCSDTVVPPAASVVLTWDEDVDLDLVLRTPDNKVVDARHPTTAFPGEDGITPEALADPTTGVFTQDSNAECTIDGRNVESIVWREAPLGTFLAYANLFDACGRRSVRFVMTVYRRQDVGGKPRLVEVERRSGVITSGAANGGAGTPLYVTALAF